MSGVIDTRTVGDQVVDQVGYAAEGDQVNVAGDYNDYSTKHYGLKSDVGDDGSNEEPSESGSGSSAAGITGGTVVGLVVAGSILYGIFGGDEPFPTQSDPWPAGVDQGAVAAVVGNWFERCQESESASPVNCPQSVGDTSGKGLGAVHWAFYGSYLEAPVIQYNKDESLFNMLGTVVASADYAVSKNPRRVVTPMKFWAKVSWVDGQLDVKEIEEHSAVGDPEVVKMEPRQPWPPVESKLKKEFERCLRGATLSLPAGCPDWQLPKDAKKVKWSLTGDPVLTARSSFDHEFGIFRVKGTYGMTVSYTSRGLAKNEARTPDYEALVTTSELGPVVLQIKDTA